MKVTETETKCRQLHKEGQSQRVPAEREEQVMAHDSGRMPEASRITENNLIDSYLGDSVMSHRKEQKLLESILDWENVQRAVKQVKRNKELQGLMA